MCKRRAGNAHLSPHAKKLGVHPGNQFLGGQRLTGEEQSCYGEGGGAFMPSGFLKQDIKNIKSQEEKLVESRTLKNFGSGDTLRRV